MVAMDALPDQPPGTPAASTRPAGIARLIVSVAQLDPALVFYRDLLGLPVRRRSWDFVWLETGDGVELLLHQRPSAASDAAVSIGFGVTGLDAVVRRWIALGGAVIDPPAAQPWGERMAVLRDADGHVVCLSEL